jgi:hypothetical protein
MKLREFWVYKYDESDTEALVYDEQKENSIHLREVSPELEAAYKECIETLKKIERDCECGQGNKCYHGAHYQMIAEKALAALKKARGE